MARREVAAAYLLRHRAQFYVPDMGDLSEIMTHYLW